ncbi:hypothetical protein WN944_008584 [Citrus x changshan-huyou]|uniref:Uncharacterized protein n=1 Tax=Citrus x changshan-huyou TaxID=2935761 RepID=A0AAP0MN77_9ROSI
MGGLAIKSLRTPLTALVPESQIGELGDVINQVAGNVNCHSTYLPFSGFFRSKRV